MAKKAMPMMPSSGGGCGTKLLLGVVGLAVAVLIVRQPVKAASMTNGGLDWIGWLIDSMSVFLASLFG